MIAEFCITIWIVASILFVLMRLRRGWLRREIETSEENYEGEFR